MSFLYAICTQWKAFSYRSVHFLDIKLASWTGLVPNNTDVYTLKGETGLVVVGVDPKLGFDNGIGSTERWRRVNFWQHSA
jgi:hypothetical protein